jgi:hypothetical protein
MSFIKEGSALDPLEAVRRTSEKIGKPFLKLDGIIG